jgi:uncharacterized heparinase superfamily protein
MISRFLNTVRYLRPVQIYSRVYRPKPRLHGFSPKLELRPPEGTWVSAIPRRNPQTGANRFRFLNAERTVESWNDSNVPKLWLYNLHYFESPNADLIQRWIEENPVGLGNGWEPYPLSLRISNWLKWKLAGHVMPPQVLQSVALQAAHLRRSIEYHLLANHLFANAKALIFAGTVLSGDCAAEWLAKGLRILASQIPEQVLSDGGHFERSPMYHCLILEDLLDLVNLSSAYPGLLPDLRSVAARMLSWMSQMTHPDSRIPFFNDAAFGIAPEPDELIDYARRLEIEPGLLPLSESGYIRLENQRGVVLFDAAPIGPDFQPGHAHADTLSFELSVDGRRQVVNSGTSNYENGDQRLRERSTPAHNTVRVDGADSSEVWSAFRVARRARPLNVDSDCLTFATAAHDGYTRLRDPVIHTRRLDLGPGELRVTDTVQAEHEHRVELYFHLHPDARVRIQLDPKLKRSEETSSWHPEFGAAVPNTTLIGRWAGKCPASFVSTIHF